MAKTPQIQFQCTICGAAYRRWQGKCDQCDSWNSIQEVSATVGGSEAIRKGMVLQPKALATATSTTNQRISSGIKEVDTVLGGGIVPGSLVLLGGQPGIGKSTILMQIAASIKDAHSLLYVSGEESLQQLSIRAERLSKNARKANAIATTSANDLIETIKQGSYDVVIVDSIQTFSLADVVASPGTVRQVTAVSSALNHVAKQSNTAIILVGHVTKEGSLAGPKVLEHLVDVVLQIEGDRYGGFKVLRGLKNRFGSTNESAILEMTSTGLQVVNNPSAALLEERQVSDGSIVLATLEGVRPLLVEIQALVTPTAFGYPRRTASGIDINRLNVLIAMMSRRTKLSLDDKDVYVNVVGGIRLTEPGSDLAVCMAIASAAKGMQLKDDAVVFGEVGLSGEVRRVLHADKRLKEAKKLGFAYAIGPKMDKAAFLRPVSSIRQALNKYLSES